MIPRAFEYERPATLGAAIAALQRLGDAGKLIAGGHSLLPMMKLRLAAPEVLVDLGDIAELRGIQERDGRLRIGSLTTHATLEHDKDVARLVPLLPRVAELIADPTVRNWGTVGGSLAHADPSADWPAAMLALGASIEIVGDKGRRLVAAQDYFKGLFDVDLRTDEVLAAVHVPLGQDKHVAYRKFRHPASGYAVVGAAVVLEVSNGRCAGGRIGITGFSDHAFRGVAGEAMLSGFDGSPDSANKIARAVFDAVEPLEDHFAGADYRRQIGRTMLLRALDDAWRGV